MYLKFKKLRVKDNKILDNYYLIGSLDDYQLVKGNGFSSMSQKTFSNNIKQSSVIFSVTKNPYLINSEIVTVNSDDIIEYSFFDGTILIDIDDVLENLCETWVAWLNEQYGTSVKYSEITEWDMSKFFPNLTKEQVYEPLHNPKLWDYVRPKHGAVEYVKKLIDEGYNVYLCTATDYKNVRPKFESVIQKYFPYISWNQVIIASHKQMIKADILVDDGVHNLENGNYIKILFSAPHNLDYDASGNCMYRVNNWEQVYNTITGLIR